MSNNQNKVVKYTESSYLVIDVVKREKSGDVIQFTVIKQNVNI